MIRGAYTFLRSLSAEKKKRGVVTCSAGNWAQGVGYGCQLLGIKALVVMPEHVSKAKLEAAKAYGAQVILHGSTSPEIFQRAHELSREKNMTYLHAWDEPSVIIGYGSIGLEILEDEPDVDVIIVSVGGGALISGICVAVKQIKPQIRVVGVQPAGAAAMYASLKEGKVVEIDKAETIADGLAVKRPGEKTFQLISRYVEDIVLVTEYEIKSAILLLLERAKLLVESSGAVPMAAVLNRKISKLNNDTKVAVVLSGGNIDLSVLKHLL